MNFQVLPLPQAAFTHLFKLDERELGARGIRRCRVIMPDSTPCRVTLDDALPGESVLLFSFAHLTAQTPYAATGPIFVREAGAERVWAVGEVPSVLRKRLLSLRAYDKSHSMVGCDVVSGSEVESLIARFLERPEVAYLHAHYARAGCFACRIERAER